eukprot:6484897-Amphidinium_carterae.1
MLDASEDLERMKTKYETWGVELPQDYRDATYTCGIASTTMAEAVLMAVLTHDKYQLSEKKAKLETSWSKQIPADTKAFGFDIKSAVHPCIKDAVMGLLLKD